MNIFILDSDPKVSAQYHTDKHIVKMPTETAQMISFVYHDVNFWDDNIPDFIMGFSKSHYNHPCSIWIRESLSNFIYACSFGEELIKEYDYRFDGKKHLRARQIFDFAKNNLPKIDDKGLTPFAEAMDDKYKLFDSAILNYREYYKSGKSHLFNWKNRETPNFII